MAFLIVTPPPGPTIVRSRPITSWPFVRRMLPPLRLGAKSMMSPADDAAIASRNVNTPSFGSVVSSNEVTVRVAACAEAANIMLKMIALTTARVSAERVN